MLDFDILYGANTAATWIFRPRDGVPSLLARCAGLVVTSWHVRRASLGALPHDLYEVLLGDACRAHLSYRSGTPGLFLTYLVQRWPSVVLKPGGLIHRHRLDGHDTKKTRDMVMHIVNGVCKPETPCKITLLDLSDIPMDGSTCLNVLQKVFASLDGRSLTVVLDLVVDAENYRPMRRLLREVAHCKQGSLGVQCSRLTMNSVGKDRLLKLTRLRESDIIVALNLDWNRLENQGLSAVLPSLAKFPNVQALSLAYNLITMSADPTLVPLAARALSGLEHLRRLNLGHNALTGSLRTLLEPLPSPLQALYLGECKLSSPDLAYLANSRHAETLQELDLGFNNLGREAPSLERLLAAAGGTLRYLDVDNARLSQTGRPVKLWQRLSHRLPALVAVSMRGNDFPAEDQVNILIHLAENALSLVYIAVCMVYEHEFEDNFPHAEWVASDDRLTQFFELYNACRGPEETEQEQEAAAGDKVTRSVIVHDLDVVSKRDALIFIHNLHKEHSA